MEATQSIIDRLNAEIASECQPFDREEAFREMIRQCYSFESVGGPFKWMDPAKILEDNDETAFRCGVNDHCDSLGLVEVGVESYEQHEVEAVKERLVESLESELEDLTNQLLEEEPGVDCADLEQQISIIKSDLETLEKHSF